MRYLHMLLAGAALAGCAVAEGPVRPTQPAVVTQPISLAERYQRVALRDDAGRPMAAITRWDAPMIWQLDAAPETAARWQSFVAAQMAELGRLSGLSIRPGTAQAATYQVVIKPADTIRAELGSWGLAVGPYFDCVTFVWPRQPLGVTFIRADLPEVDLKNCVVQETAQALGLTGDLSERTDTAFGNWATLDALSESDRQLIQLHYSVAIRHGMPAAEAMAVVRVATNEPAPLVAAAQRPAADEAAAEGPVTAAGASVDPPVAVTTVEDGRRRSGRADD